MLTSRLMRSVARTSTIAFKTQMAAPKLVYMPMRMFSKEESNFDAHSDFEPKSKA